MNEDFLDTPPQPEELQGLLRQAVDAIRATPPPAAPLDAWQRQIFQTTASLDPQRAGTLARRRRLSRRLMVLGAAAAVLAGVLVGALNLNTSGPPTVAFAHVAEQIKNAKSITWTINFYEHITSKDQKSTWAHTEVRECAFKAPGLYRETTLDDKGQVEYVEIRDLVRGRKLTCFPKRKKAVLEDERPDDRNCHPFVHDLEDLSAPNLEWVGKRKTPTGEANVFRHAFRDHDNQRDWSHDFWIDAKTKQLVAEYVPGADIHDPEKDPARNTPPGPEAWSCRMIGDGYVDIRFDVALDDSLFRLEPPQGYTVEVIPREHVTEKEMIEYLGILADFNDKVFPDRLLPESLTLMAKTNRACYKRDHPERGEELTAAERKLLETDRRYMDRFHVLPQYAPVYIFFDRDPDATVEKSFRYLGKGVKLGDKDRIVCWYKLKNAKDPKTYRVVYGDLSVRDVAPEALPLAVQP